MDLTEEKVSFDQMLTVVSELKQEISGLKTLVRTLIDAAGAAPKDAWMNIDELRAYHPDHPARPTIYEWELWFDVEKEVLTTVSIVWISCLKNSFVYPIGKDSLYLHHYGRFKFH